VARAELRKSVSMHTLRHSYATHLLEAGVNVVTLQRLLGHTSLQTTALYLHLSAQQLRQVPDLLLALDVEKIAKNNPEAAKEFRFLGEGYPEPSDIAAAMSISKNKGYASFIQPTYITDCTCESTAERAEGVVSFKSKLFEGRVPFVAQATKDGWVITEFRLPQYKTKVIRGKDGVWKQEDLKSK